MAEEIRKFLGAERDRVRGQTLLKQKKWCVEPGTVAADSWKGERV